MAPEWAAADHPGLVRLIRLIDTATTPTAAMVREIRLLEQQYGLSPRGRQLLRWRLPDHAVAEPVAAKHRSQIHRDQRQRSRRAKVLELLRTEQESDDS
jgi:hypothetical protein